MRLPAAVVVAGGVDDSLERGRGREKGVSELREQLAGEKCVVVLSDDPELAVPVTSNHVRIQQLLGEKCNREGAQTGRMSGVKSKSNMYLYLSRRLGVLAVQFNSSGINGTNFGFCAG